MRFKNSPEIIKKANCPILVSSIVKTKQFMDFSVQGFLRLRPAYKELLDSIVSNLPQRNYITIKYIEQVFTRDNLKTCRNIDWHIDGKGNDYILVCWGSNRTLFLNSPVEVDIPDGLELPRINQIIGKRDFKEASTFEVPERCLVKYSSSDIHKGREGRVGEKRIFLRVCSSDYFSPKNKIVE